MDIAKKIHNPNPRDKTSPLGALFFTYTFDVFKKGYRKVLDVDDLYDTPKNDRTTMVCERLERKWKYHLIKCCKEKKKPSFLKVIMTTFWPEYLYLGCLVTLSITCQLIKPIMLGMLLSYFNPTTMTTKSEALWYTVGFVVFTAVSSIAFSQYQINSGRYGMNMRAASCALIYRKALRLNKTALGETASGKIVNLLSNDVSRFDTVVIYIHYLWLSPLAAIYITCFLYYEGGIAGVVAMVVFFLFIPLQIYPSRLSAKYRNQTATETDERVKMMDEIITGVQVIKMYAWEKPFEKLIKFVRRLELKQITKSLFLRAFVLTVSHVMNRVCLFLTILTMVILGQQITASKVFVFLSYYQILSEAVSNIFVSGVAQVAEFRVAIERIQEFLLNEENRALDKSQPSKDKNPVILKELTVKWNPSSKENALSKINLNIHEGSLVGIIGPVGSGKSTLLQTILGELEVIFGSIEVNGIVSYASQEPWVFAATIRQNITFDSDYDHKRYNQVLNACALRKDFEEFEQGDSTIVGERGASLSGGQKSRINLARALYRNADIYLLDDPLSAVDIHVSKHLYDESINGYLAKKTKILVTHQVHLLKDADHIVILNNGSIENEGTFKELSTSGDLYAKLLTSEAEPTAEENKKAEDELKISLVSNKPLQSIATDDKRDNEKVNLIDLQEESSKGKVKGSLLWHYLRSGANVFVVCIVLLLFIGSQVVTCGVDYFVGYWVNVEESRNNLLLQNKTDEVTWSTKTYLYIYAGVLIFLWFINYGRSMFFFKLCMWSSQSLHDNMFYSIILAPMRFFDANPSGRILNRFSKDIGSIDEALPKTIVDCAEGLLMIVGALVLVVVVNVYSIIFLIIVTIPFLIQRRIYLKSSKNIKRLEGMMRSPIFTHLNASIQGLTTIRSFGAEKVLTSEFDKYQDYHNSAWYMYLTTSCAFGFYLDLLSFIFVIVVIFNFVIFGEEMGMKSGDVGLAVTQATVLTGYVQYGIRLSAEVITQLLSVERVLEYKNLPNEKQPEIPKKPPSNWPDKGEVTFEDMCLKYNEDLPTTLKNLNFTIRPNEKVGIVGRTGAGKSSIIAALFRLTIVEGSIKIDNIDTKDISLHNLRSKISIIPQDPVLFSGTLRYNLDPFEEYPDEVLYKAIEDVEMKDPANAIYKLENRVMERGSNYSVGQRQLVCLARAIIRKNKILMLDEATANVDPQTDSLIQATIRKKFADCTVLTIAHRLNTIMDSDKILVMDSGTMIEYDHPHILLQNPNGTFYKMVEETGTSLSEQLKKISQDSFQKR